MVQIRTSLINVPILVLTPLFTPYSSVGPCLLSSLDNEGSRVPRPLPHHLWFILLILETPSPTTSLCSFFTGLETKTKFKWKMEDDIGEWPTRGDWWSPILPTLYVTYLNPEVHVLPPVSDLIPSFVLLTLLVCRPQLRKSNNTL